MSKFPTFDFDVLIHSDMDITPDVLSAEAGVADDAGRVCIPRSLLHASSQQAVQDSTSVYLGNRSGRILLQTFSC